MATTRAHVVLALLVTCLLLNVAQGCVVTIRNRCSFPVTACSRSDGTPTSQYQLAAGASQGIDLGSACRWIAGVVFASVGGDCGDANLANLAEFTIGKEDVNNVDFYDLSNVNAYTIGLQIVANRAGCTSPVCSIADIRGFCQGTNQLDTFPTGALSCHNTDGQIGFATDSNRLFKQACPDAYSYDKDDTSSTFTCATGTDYDVVFCP